MGVTLSIIDGSDEVYVLGKLDGLGLLNADGSIERKTVGVALTTADG